MGVLWEFIQGKEAAGNRARLQSLVYDCSEWRWSNVLGLQMVLWQAEEWTGDTIFCQLSPEMKSSTGPIARGGECAPSSTGKPTALSPGPLLCDRERRVGLCPRYERLKRSYKPPFCCTVTLTLPTNARFLEGFEECPNGSETQVFEAVFGDPFLGWFRAAKTRPTARGD
jgi:hypothetical protein